MTQSEAGLFAVSAAFGLGFSGIVPAYVLIVRELFPSSEASWRVPTVLFISMGGMAFGSWFAGALYDHFGYYAPAFAVGVAFNLANLTLSASYWRGRDCGAASGRRWLEPSPSHALRAWVPPSPASGRGANPSD